jgi:putative FmdB family regulatory protein
MPLYEYYCRHCDGIFEALRPMRESSDPVPCIQCDEDSERIMPTSFAAFTFREGYPRKLPDRGTYWHLGKEVKKRVSGPFRPFEHPEVNKPKPKARPSKGDLSSEREKMAVRAKEARRMQASGVKPRESLFPKAVRKRR